MLNRSAKLAMSTSDLEALPGKVDIKRHSLSILYLASTNVQVYYFLIPRSDRILLFFLQFLENMN